MLIKKKIGIEKIQEKLEANLLDILDLVADGYLPMYVYEAKWKYDTLLNIDWLSLYLSENITYISYNFKVQKDSIPLIKQSRNSESFQIETSVCENNSLEQEIKMLMMKSINIFMSDFDIDHENDWDVYYQYKNEPDYGELEQDIDDDYMKYINCYEYFESMDNDSFETSEDGRIIEFNDGLVHQDTNDMISNLKNLIDDFEKNNSCCYDKYSFKLKPESDLDSACIKPTIRSRSEPVIFDDIYFLEDDVDKLINFVEHDTEDQQPRKEITDHLADKYLKTIHALTLALANDHRNFLRDKQKGVSSDNIDFTGVEKLIQTYCQTISEPRKVISLAISTPFNNPEV